MFTSLFLKKIALSFLRAFVPFFILGVIPVWENIADGDWSTGRAALIALIGASITAGIRAVQAQFTTLETPPAS